MRFELVFCSVLNFWAFYVAKREKNPPVLQITFSHLPKTCISCIVCWSFAYQIIYIRMTNGHVGLVAWNTKNGWILAGVMYNLYIYIFFKKWWIIIQCDDNSLNEDLNLWAIECTT